MTEGKTALPNPSVFSLTAENEMHFHSSETKSPGRSGSHDSWHPWRQPLPSSQMGHLVTITVIECLWTFLLLDFLLPRRKLQVAIAKAYCIPLVQVFKLFQYKLNEIVVIRFGH
jgi:hypothetical protein